MFVSGCPCGQFCLDERLKCESGGEDPTGQDKACISSQLPGITQTIFSVSWEQSKTQWNINTLNINSTQHESKLTNTEKVWNTKKQGDLKSRSLTLLSSRITDTLNSIPPHGYDPYLRYKNKIKNSAQQLTDWRFQSKEHQLLPLASCPWCCHCCDTGAQRCPRGTFVTRPEHFVKFLASCRYDIVWPV